MLSASGLVTERLARIGAASRGFVYCVATYGVTGSRRAPSTAERRARGALRTVTDLPLLVGVGIGTPEAAEACAFADGVIVGCALMAALREVARTSSWPGGGVPRAIA